MSTYAAYCAKKLLISSAAVVAGSMCDLFTHEKENTEKEKKIYLLCVES